ncbi:protein GrpE [Latilactobacillus sakei]|uniref:Protein GrpE n=1 Tax=Latilactobacillus sakei TaxID=1599 RepID=A0A9N7PBC3_LATSK|nr:nucleotide exchange factor GrpE [Latilactobacillus sakei]AWZ47093.1 nucleotide exchange factor GrpE [Latilactobacillus sakei]AYG16929.1 nucleotide exchange factor GrpE [Latilactobacillus sakei]AYG25650.1 nucleotide exchange factor GrpE [Latilactobacillus sakei]AYG29972.1 nucleotide exchange factor GrpE [Latilactobacillus sakei]AYG32569.1 nucleotide exchange factor GrpE [Latilactobacillus sakei]
MTKQEKAEKQEKPTEETVEETPKKETPFEPVMEADEVEETTEAQAPVEEADDKLAELQKKYDAMEDSFLRSQAEIKNIQMRNQKEQANLLKYDGQSLAKDVLPVLDNLERALAAEATDESLKKGVQMTYDHMKHALEDHGVKEIEAQGQAFDPTIHQAVQTVAVDGDQKADTVVQVFQKGYYLKDRVLRPAMVVVAQ